MLTLFIIVTGIILTGVFTYLTSSLFGVQASNFGKLPPHYKSLQRKLEATKSKSTDKPQS